MPISPTRSRSSRSAGSARLGARCGLPDLQRGLCGHRRPGAIAGRSMRRGDLSGPALRLSARAKPEVTGLLALILLIHSRRAARASADRPYVPLSEQDRALWDHAMIAEGARLVETALAGGRVGPFQIQAAIAALHCEAASSEATDWRQIVALYRLLAKMQPGPIVRLNLAGCAGRNRGASAGAGRDRGAGRGPRSVSAVSRGARRPAGPTGRVARGGGGV